jgi:nucleotide-binding universal stress UspA family protein
LAFPYKTILCPVDFDENSLAALEIARHLWSSIVLVHVLPLVVALGEVPPPAGLYEDQEGAVQARLDDIAKAETRRLEA